MTPASVDVFRDPFQNTNLRLTPGAGVGYTIMDRGNIEWDIGAGGGFRYTEFVSVPAGSPTTERTSAFLFGTNLDWDVTKRVEVIFAHNAEVALAASGSTNQHATLLLSFEFFNDVDLDVSVIWDRIGDPVPDEGGEVPAADDLCFSVGLGWEF